MEQLCVHTSSDLLFCTVNKQESMKDEDAGSGSMSRKKLRVTGVS